MKILYGVQGTGNGHLTRARAMAQALAHHAGVRVDWLFSGRPARDFFAMDAFGDWRWRRGLTFVTRAGRVRPLATVRGIAWREFLRDVHALELDGYDAVITDFEPVTAWAARLRGRECIGIGHQYALLRGAPRSRNSPLGNLVLAAFAPATVRLGLHWHHFGLPLLPPIVEADARALPLQVPHREVLVYLPFEDQRQVLELLREMPGWRFAVFGPGLPRRQSGHVNTSPVVGREDFVAALGRCSHVISNCGFELISEALWLGRRVLAKPLHGQAEQLSNAIALARLGFAEVVHRLDPDTVAGFLGSASAPRRLPYPDVATAIARWLVEGREPVAALSARLWRDVDATLAEDPRTRGALRAPAALAASR